MAIMAVRVQVPPRVRRPLLINRFSRVFNLTNHPFTLASSSLLLITSEKYKRSYHVDYFSLIQSVFNFVISVTERPVPEGLSPAQYPSNTFSLPSIK